MTRLWWVWVDVQGLGLLLLAVCGALALIVLTLCSVINAAMRK